jgi:hypothetical protein
LVSLADKESYCGTRRKLFSHSKVSFCASRVTLRRGTWGLLLPLKHSLLSSTHISVIIIIISDLVIRHTFSREG